MLCPIIFSCFLTLFLGDVIYANSYVGAPYYQYNQQPSCNPGYVFISGSCYNYSNTPQGISVCPNGYTLRGNWCYPGCSTCSYDTPTTTTTTIPPIIVPFPTTTTTTTTRRPTVHLTTTKPRPPDEISVCPEGSVLIRGKCRKIICPLGELVNGKCLQITCPEGKVWHGHSCREPGFITNILEIENVIHTEVNSKQGQVIRENQTKIEHFTMEPDVVLTKITTLKPTIIRPYVPDPVTENGCCTIISPRICKRYGKKWICFHRRSKRCDPKICTSPTIYLKTPKIHSSPSILVMPPNPPLQACPTPNCDSSDVIDCSSCAQNRREGCSPYCYSYICPYDACNYVDLQDYCQSYPGEFGCSDDDGCTWDWCRKR